MQFRTKILSFFAMLACSTSLLANPLVTQVIDGTMPFLEAGQEKLSLVQEEMVECPKFLAQRSAQYQQYDLIQGQLNCTQEELEGVIKLLTALNPDTVMQDQVALRQIQGQLFKAQACMNRIAHVTIGDLVQGQMAYEWRLVKVRSAKGLTKKGKKVKRQAEQETPIAREFFEAALAIATGPSIEKEAQKIKNDEQLADPAFQAEFGGQFGMVDELKGLFGAYHTLALMAGEPARTYLASNLREAPSGQTIHIIAQPQLESLDAINVAELKGSVYVLVDTLKTEVVPEPLVTEGGVIVTLSMADLYNPDYVRPNLLAKMAQTDLMSAVLDFITKQEGTLVVSVEESETHVLAYWQRIAKLLKTEETKARFILEIR